MTRANILADLINAISASKNVAIFCHVNPDGDTIGSALALYLALNSAGKKAYVFCDDVIPQKFDFLPSVKHIMRSIPKIEFDTFIACDCSDTKRLGMFEVDFLRFKGMKINIDHHVSNSRFALINYVLSSSATAELMLNILEQCSLNIDSQCAQLLMLGLMTDSGKFSYDLVNQDTFLVASKLCALGAKVDIINRHLYQELPIEQVKLYKATIQTLRFEHEGKLAFIVISQQSLKDCGAKVAHTEGFIDYPLSIKGVEVAVSLLEIRKNQYKISIRSKGRVDVNSIAKSFGGGGHLLASGCMLYGEIEEVIDRLTYSVYQHL